jgi:hypothetical protein
MPSHSLRVLAASLASSRPTDITEIFGAVGHATSILSVLLSSRKTAITECGIGSTQESAGSDNAVYDLTELEFHLLRTVPNGILERLHKIQEIGDNSTAMGLLRERGCDFVAKYEPSHQVPMSLPALDVHCLHAWEKY